jgi:hypothetical protein
MKVVKFFSAIIGVGLLLGITLGIPDSFSEQLIEAHPTSLTYSIYQNPAISGTVTDNNGNPVSDVHVYSFFSYGKEEVLTDKNGKFFLRSDEKYPQGSFSVEVYANSANYLSRTVVYFDVEEPIRQESNSTLQKSQSKNGVSIHEMIKQVKSHNLEKHQTLNQTNDNKTQFSDVTQHSKPESSQPVLTEYGRESDLIKNKNSFRDFVKSLDVLMHAIFWDQFDFTQKISEEAYEAKTSALEEGKTSIEATKVYQDTAAVSKQEVLDYLSEINVKHGFANATTQEQFDENGKYNRTSDD